MTHPESNTSAIEIIRAEPNDAAEILYMKRATWLQTYVNAEHGITEDDIYKKFPDSIMAQSIKEWQTGIASERDDGKRLTYVAKQSGRVIGFVAPAITDENKYRIESIYVEPGAQGIGVGSRLLHTALRWLGDSHDIYLDVVSYNHNAIAFYEGFGFKPSGTRMPLEIHNGIKSLPQIEMVRPAEPSN